MHAHFPKLKLRKLERSIRLGENTRFSNNKKVNCWNTDYILLISTFYYGESTFIFLLLIAKQ